MSRNWKIVTGVVIVALVAALVIVAVNSGGSSSSANEVVIFSKVQTRNLQDTVELNGTLSRKQIRNVTSATSGLLSAVTTSNGTTGQNNQVLFAINGRNAVAEDGTTPFFRPLTLGDQGEDVLQLKRILAASGDYPGSMNDYFTQSTTFALAQWQAQHHYPNSSPANPESVNVSLEQGTGYKLGTQDSAGLIINPPAPRTTAYARDGATVATLDATVSSDGPAVTPTVTVTIQSVDAEVPQGEPATFVISSSKALAAPLTVHVTTGRVGRQPGHRHPPDHRHPAGRAHPDRVHGPDQGQHGGRAEPHRGGLPQRGHRVRGGDTGLGPDRHQEHQRAGPDHQRLDHRGPRRPATLTVTASQAPVAPSRWCCRRPAAPRRAPTTTRSTRS